MICQGSIWILKYPLLIKGREKVGIEQIKNPKTFIYYSQTIDHVYENLEDYNPIKKIKILIVFDDIIADMEPNIKSSPIATKLFFTEIKLYISLAFI